MRTIELTTGFKRDYRRASKGPHGATLDASLRPVVDTLVHDRPLDPDTATTCCVRNGPITATVSWKPDLVLIYRKPDAETLLLVRLGSHAELELR